MNSEHDELFTTVIVISVVSQCRHVPSVECPLLYVIGSPSRSRIRNDTKLFGLWARSDRAGAASESEFPKPTLPFRALP